MVEGDLAALVGRLEATEEVERAGRPRSSASSRTAAAAAGEKVEMSSSPSTARSWLPTRHTLAALGHEAGALVGLGAVADHVAEAPELADAGPLDVGEYGFERRQVRVDVAQHGQSHEETSGLS